MAKRFLVGVANIFAYHKTTGNELFTSRTMIDTAIEISTDSTNINGGVGNALQYIYFHTPELSLTLTETQFNLGMIASNVGSDITTGGDIWDEETVVLGVAGAGVITATPIIQPDIAGAVIYGWVTDAAGITTKVTFTGSNFTLAGGTDGETVCVRYYTNNSSIRVVTIPANFIPASIRLVMECSLASSDDVSAAGGSIIGKIQFEINTAQLSGAQSIEMSSSGVSQTPLTAMALASPSGVGGCIGSSVYGTIKEVIAGANWYDNVYALAITNGEIDITGVGTETLEVIAIPIQGTAFIVPDYTDLTFTSLDLAVATVAATGVITGVAAGDTSVTVGITAKASVDDAAAIVTVT